MTNANAPDERFTLPAELSLGPVRLAVPDLDRSSEYYRGILGLRELSRSGGSVSLGASDDGELVHLEHAPRAKSLTLPRLGLYHFAFLLPSRVHLGAFVGHLQERRVPFGASDHSVSEALYLRDPDGLGIEVYADRARSSWQLNAGELHMTSAPLDIDSLLEAARETEWTEMPTGTVMGHLHLHVGDLVRASEFYHGRLGFERVVWSYPGALFLAAGGYHHHLGVNTWAQGALPASEGDARLMEWTIRLPSEDIAHVLAERVASARVPSDSDLLLADPWGTRVRFVTTSG